MRSFWVLLALATMTWGGTGVARAQDAEEAAAAELAKKLANPIASLIAESMLARIREQHSPFP